MYSQQAIQLRRDNQALHAKMVALNKKAADEKRALSAEEDAQWNAMDAEFEGRVKEIARLEKLAQRDKDLGTLDNRRAGREGGDGVDHIPEDLRGDGKHKPTPESRARASRALRAFMGQHPSEWDDDVRAEIKRTQAGLPKEARALSQVTGSAGAFTIAQDFMPELDRAMKSYSGIMQGCRLITTDDGADLPWPKVDDTGNSGARLGEGSAANDTTDPTFASVTLKSYTYTSKIIRVPIPLLMDTAFDLEAELFDMLGERIGRIFNNEATLADGSSKPRGLITALLADTTPVAAAGANAITYGDIVTLEHAVDPAYRSQAGAAFMLHDTILAALKKIVDSNGRPLFMPANDAPGTPGTLMGRPYFINQDMDNAISTQKETIVFGLLKKMIARRAGRPILMRLGERYAEYFQVGFVAFDRLDSQLVSGSSSAVRVLQQP